MPCHHRHHRHQCHDRHRHRIASVGCYVLCFVWGGCCLRLSARARAHTHTRMTAGMSAQICETRTKTKGQTYKFKYSDRCLCVCDTGFETYSRHTHTQSTCRLSRPLGIRNVAVANTQNARTMCATHVRTPSGHTRTTITIPLHINHTHIPNMFILWAHTPTHTHACEVHRVVVVQSLTGL